jgi:SPP1 gp7 family putative phage head morphogenesis protein
VVQVSESSEEPEQRDADVWIIPDEVVQLDDYRSKQQDAEIQRILDEGLRAERIETDLAPEYEEQLRQWGEQSLAGLDVGPESFALLNPLIVPEVERFGAESITQIHETTRDQVRGVLADGFRRGLGPRALAGEIERLYEDFDEVRAVRIARTEMLRASNAGQYAALRVAEVPRKQWLTTMDGLQRQPHGSLHLTIIDTDERFEVAGGEARYPGDFGRAELDINCRCTIAPVTGERGMSPPEAKAYWGAYDKALSDSERTFVEAVRASFTRQLREDLLPVLRTTMEVA